jgi:hypothetical protein
MTTNPNPARITAASWWFMEQLLSLQAGTTNGGTYTNKPGYHGTRSENYARNGWQDYSVRAAADRLGPDDKTAGYDWVFASAKAGDYGPMAKYGGRLRATFNTRDPRLAGWREALGQVDADKAAEGLDFQGWYERVPDSTHEWHWHLSELRQHVASYENKAAMLSVLRGETLAQWQQGSNGMWDPTLHEAVNALAGGSIDKGFLTGTETRDQAGGSLAWSSQFNMRVICAKLDASAAREVATGKAIDALSAVIMSGGGTVETAPIIAAIREVGADVEQLHEQLAAATARTEAAERRENLLLAQAHTAATTEG